jgi:hypothetical protein
MIRARKFFYVCFDEASGRIEIQSTVRDRYETLVQELTLNGVQVLFIAAYDGLVGRMIYKYLQLLVETNRQTLLDEYCAANSWVITQPWLLYDRFGRQFVQASEPVWRDVEMVGWIGSRAIVDRLCKNDLI